MCVYIYDEVIGLSVLDDDDKVDAATGMAALFALIAIERGFCT